MSYIPRFFLISVLIAVIALLLGYSMELHWPGAITAVGLGFFIWYGQHKQKWPWSINLFLIGVVILVSVGIILRLKLYFLLPALLGALAAWDLARFQQRIYDTQGLETVQKIERRHLGLLTLAIVSGGILSGIVLVTQLQISFGFTLALGVILIISFGQIYRMLNN